MSDASLIRYDAMCHAIAECHRVDEVKDIRDKAKALELYFKIARNKEAEHKAGEIRIRAERKTGQLLAEMKTTGKLKDRRPEKGSDAPTLKKLKITKDQSSQWQELARIPEAEFEENLANYPTVPNTEGMIMSRRAEQPPPTEIQEAAWSFFQMLRSFHNSTFRNWNATDLITELNDETETEVFRFTSELTLWLQPLTKSQRIRRVK